jgi:hypothetical protein
MRLLTTQTLPGLEPRLRSFDWQRLLVLAVLFAAPIAFVLLYTPPDRTTHARRAGFSHGERLDAVTDASAPTEIPNVGQ